MHFNIDTLLGVLYGGGASGIVALIAQQATKIPAWVMAREKTRFETAVKAGKIDAATARMIRAQMRAAFAWANEEMPASPNDRKMDEILDCAAQIPCVGLLVNADRAAIRAVLIAEWNAWREEIGKEAKPVAAAPVSAAAITP